MTTPTELIGGPLDGLPVMADHELLGLAVRTAADRLAMYVYQYQDNGRRRFRFTGYDAGRSPTHIVHLGVMVPIVGEVK
jgi:hypothetical protein